MTEGWGRNKSGCWTPSIQRRNTQKNIVSGNPVVSNFPNTYVQMEGNFQCDCECFKASESFHGSSKFIHFYTFANLPLNPAFLKEHCYFHIN